MDENNQSEQIGKETSNQSSEFNAQLNQQAESLKALQNSQKEIAEYLKSITAKNDKESDQSSDSISNLLISDPDKAVELIEKRVEGKIKKRMADETNKNQEVQQVLNSLQMEFPELSDQNHELTKTALSIYEKMSQKEKDHPLSYKAAITEAALKTGTKPKSQRNYDDGDFSLSSSRGGTAPRSSKIDPKTLEFAKIMGLNVEDKGVLARLTESSQQDLSRYTKLT